MTSTRITGTRLYPLHKAALRPVLDGELPNAWDLPEGVLPYAFARFLYKEKLHLI